MQRSKGAKNLDFIPQTFLLPSESRELLTAHFRYRGPWIVKPKASSRGRGIYIVNSVSIKFLGMILFDQRFTVYICFIFSFQKLNERSIVKHQSTWLKNWQTSFISSIYLWDNDTKIENEGNSENLSYPLIKMSYRNFKSCALYGSLIR